VNESDYSNEVYTIYCSDNVCDAGECIAGCTDDCSVDDCCGTAGCNVAIGETVGNCPGIVAKIRHRLNLEHQVCRVWGIVE